MPGGRGLRRLCKDNIWVYPSPPFYRPLLLAIKADDWVSIFPGVLSFMTYSITGPSELNIHHELFIPLLFFFLFFSFYKATWDTFASGLEVEMTPCTQWLLSCDFKDTRKHNKRGHVWVHWRNHSLGSVAWDGDMGRCGHIVFRTVSIFLGTRRWQWQPTETQPELR